MAKKRILLTNDDGFDSRGLRALVDAVRDIAIVTVVAPASEKSACGHSLTLTRPLRLVEVDDDFFKLDDGTPSDCVYLALNTLFADGYKPDLIISGINIGANMGEDITYSGTASAAMEGVLYGVPSIAISQVCVDKCQGMEFFEYTVAKKVIRELVEAIFAGVFPLGERRFLNLNIPPIELDEYQGIKITKAGHREYFNNAEMHRNPRGVEYYWLGLHPLSWRKDDSGVMSDFDAVEAGFVSISPIKLDMTSHEDLVVLERFIGSI